MTGFVVVTRRDIPIRVVPGIVSQNHAYDIVKQLDKTLEGSPPCRVFYVECMAKCFELVEADGSHYKWEQP